MPYKFFFRLASPFSNFHPARFEIDGRVFASNEQYMMFMKAITFEDKLTADKVMTISDDLIVNRFLNGEINSDDIINSKDLASEWQKSMVKAKRLGRVVVGYDDNIWADKRYNIVRLGATEKFKQNEHLKNILLETGDAKMVEANPADKIWSCGLNKLDASKLSENEWPGLNLLGKILDEVRADLKNNLSERLKP